MVSKKLFSAVVATAVILSIVGASSIAFAQTQTSTATASATASGGFLGLPGFEAVYGVVGLLAVAYLVMLRRK